MLRFLKPSQEYAKSSKNGPEENDETDSENSLLTSEIKSFDFAAGPMPKTSCSNDRGFSNYSGQFSQLPSHSAENVKSYAAAAAAAAATQPKEYPYFSPTGHVENWHVPCVSNCGDCYTYKSDNWLSNTGMTEVSLSGSFRPSLPTSLHSSLGLSQLEPGFPLQSYQFQLPGHPLPQNPCRPRVSVYVPEPGHFPPTPLGRVDLPPYGTPGFNPPNGPGNVSFQRAVAPTDPVNTNAPFSLVLPREQRKVFVTYATDNDRHVEEVIKFVALLIRNGFETQIDMFEQNFRSINKIDWMERYINDKGYLIIIVISPKYWEAVTSQNFDMKNDEHSLNTVFIYKQLQNEFIQNGSKNFRFLPIIFPGANMNHVPSWLQNTHVYRWPMQTQDILRRLMRLEKYNPPPVGELPTIIQKSI